MRLLLSAIIALSVLGLVVGFALAARRLLGLRFGAVRLLLAGLLAFVVAGPIAQSMATVAPPDTSGIAPLWLLILAGASALLVAMVFLVVAEALLPGSSRGPVDTVRALRNRLARSRRSPRSPGSCCATASLPTCGGAARTSTRRVAGCASHARCAARWTTAG